MDTELYTRISQAAEAYRTAGRDLDATSLIFDATHQRLSDLMAAGDDDDYGQAAFVLDFLTRATEGALNRRRAAEVELAKAIAEVDDLDELERIDRETGGRFTRQIATERSIRAGAFD
jgi:hypothetical protein